MGALVKLVALSAKDPVSKAIEDISLRFCQQVITDDVPTLSMLTRTRINSGLHNGQAHGGDPYENGNEFLPQNHKENTILQYTGVLASLGLFFVRGCITDVKGQDHYGVSLDFFTEPQRNAALQLHDAIAVYTEDTDDAESANAAADVLYNLAMSVWFAPLHPHDSSSWSTTWRRFVSISALSPKPNYRCHEPGVIAIWLSRLKFCMKIVACHKIRSDYLAQRDASGAFPSAALRDDELVPSRFPPLVKLTSHHRISVEWLKRWFSVDTPSPYQEMRSFAAKASKFSYMGNSKHDVFWSPGACRATPFGTERPLIQPTRGQPNDLPRC